MSHSQVRRDSRDSRGAAADAVALSVVLPCYRAPSLAIRSANALSSFLEGRIPSWEVIVVDDGGADFPASPFENEPGRTGSVRLIQLAENRGKGAAVAAGMRAATGAVRVFTDVDLPYGMAPILLVESIIRKRGIHVVIGDRTFPQSRYSVDLPLMRRAASRVFSLLTATLVTGGFFDTQCGLKGFRGDIAEALFAMQRLERFAFDVELLYLALTYGLEIKRIPVVLEENRTSSVRIGRDALRSCADLARLRVNRFRGRYDCPRLRELVADECRVLAATL